MKYLKLIKLKILKFVIIPKNQKIYIKDSKILKELIRILEIIWKNFKLK